MTAERALLVASTGGHLEELARLRHRLQPAPRTIIWSTFDTEQSRSLLAGERIRHVPMVPPRGYLAALRTFPYAWRILRAERIDLVVTTGAGVALPFLLLARMLGIPAHFIESAARSEGPSLTGRIAALLPGVRLYTQYEGWATRRWVFVGSLFDAYALHDLTETRPAPSPRERVDSVVVTLGTHANYPFDRAVAALARVLPVCSSRDVLWQVGTADTSPYDIEATEQLPADAIRRRIESADLVVAHAGVGSVLNAWDSGHCPVLLPRRARHREHVDDHQLLIARELDRRGLAVSRDPDDLRPEDLELARRRRIVRTAAPRPFPLSA